MKILLLGPERPRIREHLESFGDSVIRLETPITASTAEVMWADWLVSYGYRHIIRKSILDRFPRRSINLHISYLPHNRGADPNLWSFLEDTPKGVSIHFLAPEVDAGDVIIQRLVPMSPNETLRTSYDKLSCAMEDLFTEHWSRIREGNCNAFPQPKGGSSHKLIDKAQYESLLTQGWDTPVSRLVGRALNRETVK
jgi:methionyl-tRNA formyltransferase